MSRHWSPEPTVLHFPSLARVKRGAPTLYRLAPGTTTWRSLGVVPAGGMVYVPTITGGVLWVIQEGLVAFTATYA